MHYFKRNNICHVRLTTSNNHDIFAQPWNFTNQSEWAYRMKWWELVPISFRMGKDYVLRKTICRLENVVTLKEVWTLEMFCTTCVYCMSRHLEEDEIEGWLRCPACMQRCFEIFFQLYAYFIYYKIKLSYGQKPIQTFWNFQENMSLWCWIVCFYVITVLICLFLSVVKRYLIDY